MEDIYLIYSLSHNDTVFYIGKSKCLWRRYLEHIKADCCTAISIYISNLLNEGYEIDLSIIDHCDKKDAKIAEKFTIKTMCSMGVPLCNVEFNPFHNRIKPMRYYDSLPEIEWLEDKIRALKQAQKNYLKIITSVHARRYIDNSKIIA